ncbi:MAG: zinc ABC transporter substrate-binding protein [Phycisphaerales bacterium]|nr:zinc ABC transporter substrate-binding protein [Phycisphaerales bacterium]
MKRRAWIKVAGGMAAGVLAAAVGVGLPACSKEAERSASAPLREPGAARIVATIAPLGALTRELLPEGAQLRVLLPPGRSEHGYEPTPVDIAALARADVVVYVGLGLEPRVEEFLKKNPSARRVDLSMAASLKLEGDEHNHEHEHGHAGDAGRGGGSETTSDDPHAGHDHGPIDPHVWLDPVLVKEFVTPLADAVDHAVRAAGPMSAEQETKLAALREALAKKVDDLHAEYGAALEPLAGRSIVTHHSAWGRLAGRYGLKVAAVLRPIETAESTPADIAGAVAAVKERGAGAIFVEPQFNNESAKRVADAAGVKMLVLDPLGGEDYFVMMRTNLTALQDGLAGK